MREKPTGKMWVFFHLNTPNTTFLMRNLYHRWSQLRHIFQKPGYELGPWGGTFVNTIKFEGNKKNKTQKSVGFLFMVITWNSSSVSKICLTLVIKTLKHKNGEQGNVLSHFITLVFSGVWKRNQWHEMGLQCVKFCVKSKQSSLHKKWSFPLRIFLCSG